jgi:hypothetical protein
MGLRLSFIQARLAQQADVMISAVGSYSRWAIELSCPPLMRCAPVSRVSRKHVGVTGVLAVEGILAQVWFVHVLVRVLM